MRLVIRLSTNGKYRAYFDKTPDFYGEGDTREEAIKSLCEKMYAVLEAVSNIQKGI